MSAPVAAEQSVEESAAADAASDRQSDTSAAPATSAVQPSAELRASSSSGAAGGPIAPLRRRFIRSEPRPGGPQAPTGDGAGSGTEVSRRLLYCRAVSLELYMTSQARCEWPDCCCWHPVMELAQGHSKQRSATAFPVHNVPDMHANAGPDSPCLLAGCDAGSAVDGRAPACISVCRSVASAIGGPPVNGGRVQPGGLDRPASAAILHRPAASAVHRAAAAAAAATAWVEGQVRMRLRGVSGASRSCC